MLPLVAPRYCLYVWLNPGSSSAWLKQYNAGQRNLDLTMSVPHCYDRWKGWRTGNYYEKVSIYMILQGITFSSGLLGHTTNDHSPIFLWRAQAYVGCVLHKLAVSLFAISRIIPLSSFYYLYILPVMVFRLPTPFDSVPSTRLRGPHSRPWRGTFILHNIDSTDASGEMPRLHICSAETEGDK